jgi:type II secretory pathway component PulK
MLTLWVVLLLTVMAYGLIERTRLGIRREQWDRTESEARELVTSLAAWSLLQAGQEQTPEIDSYNEPWMRPFALDSRWLDPAFDRQGSGPFLLTVQVTDEAGKININLAPETLLAHTLEAAGVAAAVDLAAAVVDWRDQDDAGPAEAEAYAAIVGGYRPPNTDFARIQELRFVKGVDATLFEGEDANQNGTLDPNEDDGDTTWPPDNQDGRLQLALGDLFTVLGSGEVNVNTAPVPVLRALFAELAVEEAAADRFTAAILSSRRGKDALEGTEDDQPLQDDDALQAVLLRALGQGNDAEAQRLLQPFTFATTAVRYTVKAEFTDTGYSTGGQLLVLRQEDRVRVLEWNRL